MFLLLPRQQLDTMRRDILQRLPLLHISVRCLVIPYRRFSSGSAHCALTKACVRRAYLVAHLYLYKVGARHPEEFSTCLVDEEAAVVTFGVGDGCRFDVCYLLLTSEDVFKVDDGQVGVSEGNFHNWLGRQFTPGRTRHLTVCFGLFP